MGGVRSSSPVDRVQVSFHTRSVPPAAMMSAFPPRSAPCSCNCRRASARTAWTRSLRPLISVLREENVRARLKESSCRTADGHAHQQFDRHPPGREQLREAVAVQMRGERRLEAQLRPAGPYRRPDDLEFQAVGLGAIAAVVTAAATTP